MRLGEKETGYAESVELGVAETRRIWNWGQIFDLSGVKIGLPIMSLLRSEDQCGGFARMLEPFADSHAIDASAKQGFEKGVRFGKVNERQCKPW